MAVDRYTRVVLTVIAVALVYLCVVLTPLPTVSAQRGLRPGDDTGPAQVVVIGWRAPERLPVQLSDNAPVRITGDVSVNGLVQVDLPPNKVGRVVVTGWEDNAPQPGANQFNVGTFRAINPRATNANLRGLPVTAFPPD